MSLVRSLFRHALLVGAVLTTLLAAPARGQIDPPTPIDEVRPTQRPAAVIRPPAKAKGERLAGPKADAAVEIPSDREKASSVPPRTAPARSELKPLLPSTATDEDLAATWARWRKAILEPDTKSAEEAQRQLIALKGELGVADLDTFSVGFIRAAEAKMTVNDAMGAVGLAAAAAELAPDLPHGHLALAKAYAFADPADVSRYASEVARAVRSLAPPVDPRACTRVRGRSCR